MLTVAKISLVQAAAVAAVWVMASTLAQGDENAPAKTEARHPALAVEQAFAPFGNVAQVKSELRHTIGAPKADLLVKQDTCSGQSWPYIATECLTGEIPARRVARTITVERRNGETSSALVRVSAEPQMAQR